MRLNKVLRTGCACRFATYLGRLVRKKHMRHFTISIVILFLAGCSDDAPREKIYSFLYSTFYLKVIDQDGRPVSGVETDIRHGGNSFYFGSNSGWARYISDSKGIISIKVDSRQISFDRMSKDGYSINLPKILFEYYKTRSYEVPAQGNLWPPDFRNFNKESPFIIKAWRIDDNELLAKCRNGLVKQFLNTDGRTYGVDLLKPSKEVVVEGAQKRSIQIRFKRDSVERFGAQKSLSRNEVFKQSWSYSLNVTNGGIKEIIPDELYKKIPPRSGFLNSWELTNTSFRTRKNEYSGASHEDDRHFYLKLNDEYYARLSIRFEPVGSYHDHFQSGAITLDYSVNIDDSGFVRGIDEIGQFKHSSQYHKDGCVEYVRGKEKKNNRFYP